MTFFDGVDIRISSHDAAPVYTEAYAQIISLLRYLDYLETISQMQQSKQGECEG